LLLEHNAFDFDNLILKTLEILKKYPEILKKYQKKYSYFLIDEFQDTNSPQYQLIKLLASKNKNITVVGDDWQSIYGFRSADYRILLNFQKDWPQAKIFFLEQNYRSTQNILDASYSVISKNIFRTDKKLFTTNGKGELIKVLKFKDEREEALWIKEQIIKKLKSGKSLNDFAILFRTNVQSRVFEDLLISEKIPYQLIGAFKFYQRKEIQDIVSYLRYIYNPNDKISLERIINIPKRKIGESTIKILKDNDWNFEVLKNKPVFKQLENFNFLIRKLESASRELPMSSFLTFIIDSLNYKNYLDITTEEGLERWQNIKELIGIAYNFDRFSPKEGFENFLESISLLQEADNFDKNANKLTLMTLHSAKGLEFPIIFIPGVEESLIPHEKSLYNQENLEEERRLFYVGMTRAKQELYLTYAEERFLNGEYRHNEPSRFLDEIDENLKENFDITEVELDYEQKIEYF
jgi:DNA helicase-2/ATP-dependent DNA helicase PcrA